MRICNDLIIYICEYMSNYKYYFINKYVYNMLLIQEKNIYWKNKYNSFFESLNKNFLILDGSYNWKRQYIRINKFKYWNMVDSTSKLLLLKYENHVNNDIKF